MGFSDEMDLQFGFKYVIAYDNTYVITYVIAYVITYFITYVITYVITYPYAWTVNFTKPLCLKGASNMTNPCPHEKHWFSSGI